MTRTPPHVDDDALTTIAAHDAAAPDDVSHIEQCSICSQELAIWRRISNLARASVESVPLASEDLAERVLGQLDGPDRGPVPKNRPAHPQGGWSRRVRWLIAAPIITAAVVLVATLGFGPTVPSDALVLKTIRNSPEVAAMASETVHESEYEVFTAPQGYTVIEYRTQGAFSPRTNAFVLTSKEIEPGGPRLNPYTTVSDGSLVYLPCLADQPFLGYKGCVAYPAQAGTAPGSPTLAFLRSAQGPVVRLGHRQIDGIATTGYGVTVPANAVVQSQIPSLRSLIQYDISADEAFDFHMDVWSDNRGLPREVDETFVIRQHQADLPPLLHVSVKKTLTYGSSFLQVSVPARSNVAVEPNIEAAVFYEDLYENALATYNDQFGHGFKNSLSR
jgi:hypothetical protein